jgi:hypothetical protein
LKRGHEDTTTTSQFDLLVGFSMLIELWQSRVRIRKAGVFSTLTEAWHTNAPRLCRHLECGWARECYQRQGNSRCTSRKTRTRRMPTCRRRAHTNTMLQFEVSMDAWSLHYQGRGDGEYTQMVLPISRTQQQAGEHSNPLVSSTTP